MRQLDLRLAQDGLIGLNKGGERFYREVATEELLGIMKQGASFSTGMLPPNTRYFAQRGLATVIAIELRQILRTIMISGYGKLEEVPLPGGVFILRVNHIAGAFQFTGCGIFAIKGGLQSMDQPLFRFPTPNTDCAGTICWGDQRDPTFNMPALAGAENLVRAFLSSNFNHHMWEGTGTSQAAKTAIKDWLNPYTYFAALKTLGTFPDEYLNTTPYTFRTALARIAGDIVAQ